MRGQRRSLSHVVCSERAVAEMSFHDSSVSAQAVQPAACCAAFCMASGEPSKRRSSS
jgi:hypothetical protein